MVTPYFFLTIYLLPTEEETGKIINDFVGNFKVGRIPLHNFFYNFAHAFHILLLNDFFVF